MRETRRDAEKMKSGSERKRERMRDGGRKRNKAREENRRGRKEMFTVEGKI